MSGRHGPAELLSFLEKIQINGATRKRCSLASRTSWKLYNELHGFGFCCLSSLLGRLLFRSSILIHFCCHNSSPMLLERTSLRLLFTKSDSGIIFTLVLSLVGSSSEVSRHFFTSRQEYCHTTLRYLQEVREDMEVQGYHVNGMLPQLQATGNRGCFPSSFCRNLSLCFATCEFQTMTCSIPVSGGI